MLYEDANKEEFLKFKLDASLHDKELKSEGNDKQQSGPDKQSSRPLFRDPKDYENMTPEEKKIETKRMMRFFKNTKARSSKIMGL